MKTHTPRTSSAIALLSVLAAALLAACSPGAPSPTAPADGTLVRDTLRARAGELSVQHAADAPPPAPHRVESNGAGESNYIVIY